MVKLNNTAKIHNVIIILTINPCQYRLQESIKKKKIWIA